MPIDPTPNEPPLKVEGFSTRQIHAGQRPDPHTGSRALPIYATTAYAFDSTEHAEDLFALRAPGNIYTRIMNPTQQVVEDRMANLEGGVAALLLATGQSAVTLSILNLASAGDHVVAASQLYGGTTNLLQHTLRRFGIETTFVHELNDADEWRRAIQPNTKLCFGETLGNPNSDVLDVAMVSEVAHDAGCPLVVDNTLATPFLFRPIEHGADIVVHSASKFLAGHGTALVGVIVDGGSFDWASSDRFASFVDPDPTYHGVSFAEQFGAAAYIARVRTQLLRDLGPAVSPFHAFLLAQGLETLSLRMERHSENALRIAQWLEKRGDVEVVHYPGLESSPHRKRATKYLSCGAGGVLSFELRGGYDAGRTLVDGVELWSHVANIGDVRSLIIHPASTTHSQLSEAERQASGVTPGLVRLSVGLEDVEDLEADLGRALGDVA